MDAGVSFLSEYGSYNLNFQENSCLSLTKRVLFPIVVSSGTLDEPTSHFTTPERHLAAPAYWEGRTGQSPSPRPMSMIPPGHIQGHVSVVIDEDSTWLENLHLVLDDHTFLLVSRDPKEMDKGTVRLIAPISQTGN